MQSMNQSLSVFAFVKAVFTQAFRALPTSFFVVTLLALSDAGIVLVLPMLQALIHIDLSNIVTFLLVLREIFALYLSLVLLNKINGLLVESRADGWFEGLKRLLPVIGFMLMFSCVMVSLFWASFTLLRVLQPLLGITALHALQAFIARGLSIGMLYIVTR